MYGLSYGILLKVMYMYKNFLKRIFDFLFSLVFSIILFPIFIIIGLLIKLEDGGPIFYKQKRVGYKNKVFTIYKFRSMNIMKEQDELSVDQSTRITKIGHILRKTSLDELPQVFNILKGEMSFIGPRPWTDDLLPHYTKKQLKRHSVRPGITGLAQVNGRNCINILERISYDLKYVENVSFINDCIILIKTIKLLFSSFSKQKLKLEKQGSRLEDLDILKNYNNMDDMIDIPSDTGKELIYN